jgi:DNA-binding IclR family transcriptional regulator
LRRAAGRLSRNRAAPLHARFTDLDPGDQPQFAQSDDKQFVTALARGLDVLRAFSEGAALLGNQEIAAITRLPKPTVSRLTYTLARLGFLDYEARLGKYRPGLAGLALGYNALRSLPVRRVAQPLMQELARTAGVTVSLIVRDRLDIMFIEQCGNDADSAFRRDLGARLPVTSTGMARCLIVGLPRPERLYVLEHLERRHPHEWPRMEKEIYQALAEYQRLGFTICDGDGAHQMASVGLPLAAQDASRVMALNCSAPEFRVPRERLIAEVGPRLLEMEGRVRQSLAALTGS